MDYTDDSHWKWQFDVHAKEFDKEFAHDQTPMIHYTILAKVSGACWYS